MEYWEITKERAQQSLPIWLLYLPNEKVGGQGTADLEAYINQFEPAAGARTAAQDQFDAAHRLVTGGLLRMKKIAIGIPKLIEVKVPDDELLQKDVDDLYSTPLRTEANILKRMRELLPLWTRANEALAAMTPAEPPITIKVGGVTYTVATATTFFEGHTGRVNTRQTKETALNKKRSELRALDRSADTLNKRFYKMAKLEGENLPALADALEGITTEGGTSAPELYEMDDLTQGGEGGLQVLVSYLPGGGDHATTKLIKWMVEGVDADFTHSAPLDPSGNALGPFTVGQVVKVMTEVSNSAGTRTSAVRTITMEEPV